MVVLRLAGTRRRTMRQRRKNESVNKWPSHKMVYTQNCSLAWRSGVSIFISRREFPGTTMFHVFNGAFAHLPCGRMEADRYSSKIIHKKSQIGIRPSWHTSSSHPSAAITRQPSLVSLSPTSTILHAPGLAVDLTLLAVASVVATTVFVVCSLPSPGRPSGPRCAAASKSSSGTVPFPPSTPSIP